MRTVRLTIVSDTHLSPRTPEAADNWDALVGHVERAAPDAVIHAGDLTLDGTTDSTELSYARARLDAMPVTTYVLPGNHDLGDNPCETNGGSSHLITSDRLATYRDLVGDDRWAIDLGPWRLVGLNAQLLGSGLPAEDEQWDWLDQELAPERFEGRHPAVFLHKPLFHSDPQPAEHDEPGRYVRPVARARLLSMLASVGVRVVVTGHVHQYRRFGARGMEHVWAPTAWATISPSSQATIGDRWVGGLDLALEEDGSMRLNQVRPDGVRQHVIGETIPNPY